MSGLPPTLTLLLSAFAQRTWGARIVAAIPGRKLVFVTAEAVSAADAPCDAEIAFMTREVTGGSTPGKPIPELRAFEDALRRSPRLGWLRILLPLLGARSAPAIALTAAAGSFGVFHVFYHWLKVPLPIGAFGI